MNEWPAMERLPDVSRGGVRKRNEGAGRALHRFCFKKAGVDHDGGSIRPKMAPRYGGADIFDG
jgi:hypothetical protein